MKVTNPDVIKNGESELIDAITADVDWGAIEKIFTERHKLGIEEDVEYRNGDIVVCDGQIAYKLEFDIRVTMSVLLDREGNYIDMSTSNDTGKTDKDALSNDSVESIPDHGGDENILEEVLSGTGVDNDDVITASSQGEKTK